MLYEYRSTSCDPDHSAVGESARARSQGNHDRQKGPDGKIGFVLLYGSASPLPLMLSLPKQQGEG